MKTKALILATALIWGARAWAIELSLEENRSRRGSIGYVDMQKLFKAYPETIRAKENFEDVVRQAEEQVNLRKAAVLRQRNELSQLKIQRDFIAKNPIVSSAPVSALPAVSTMTAAMQSLPGFAGSAAASTAPAVALSTPPAAMPASAVPAISTAAAATPAQAVPVVSTAPATPASAVPAISTAAAATPAQAVPVVSTAPAATLASVVPVVSTAAAPPQAGAAPSAGTANRALSELDLKIAQAAKDLAQKEADFKEYQASSEKNLLDLESRKTEILLGKIHKAIKSVARREGISVVVDKSNIIFGHDTVDLTDKVLKELGGP